MLDDYNSQKTAVHILRSRVSSSDNQEITHTQKKNQEETQLWSRLRLVVFYNPVITWPPPCFARLCELWKSEITCFSLSGFSQTVSQGAQCNSIPVVDCDPEYPCYAATWKLDLTSSCQLYERLIRLLLCLSLMEKDYTVAAVIFS